MNAFSYESFVNFRVSFHLRVNHFYERFLKMFDFKRIIHQTNLMIPEMLPGYNFVFRST